MPCTRDFQDYCTEQKVQTDGVYIVYAKGRNASRDTSSRALPRQGGGKKGRDCGFESRSFAGISKATKNKTSTILIVSDFNEGLTFFLPYLFCVAYIDPLIVWLVLRRRLPIYCLTFSLP